METVCVSIDYSLNSTGITIYNCDTKIYKFLSFVNIYKNKNGVEGTLKSIGGAVEIEKYLRSPMLAVKSQACGLSGWEKLHIQNCLIYNKELKEFICKNILKTNKNILIFENYSYSANSDTLIQLVENTMSLKLYLLNSDYFSVENIFLVTGPQIKMLAGKGNFDKYDMLKAFINTDDDSAKNTKFYKFVKDNVDKLITPKIKNGKEIFEVLTPIDDIIDSFWINKYFQVNFKEFI